ncbi:MAG: hypothetical protein IIX99_03410, partial [Oscillospiraceae bacterium]|nr:hypothetical protein [Oscillospiraceae bacterium]
MRDRKHFSVRKRAKSPQIAGFECAAADCSPFVEAVFRLLRQDKKDRCLVTAVFFIILIHATH